MLKRTDRGEVMGLEVDGSRLVAAVGGIGRANGGLAAEAVEVASTVGAGGSAEGTPALASMIAELRSRLPRAPGRVRLGIGGPDTAMRLIDVPCPRRRADLEAVIEQEAEQRVPMPLARSHWTARVLGRFSDPDSGNWARVLVAAAKHEAVDPFCAALREGGCEVVGIDLSAFAAIRALPWRQGTWLGVMLAAQPTLFVADGRNCLLTHTPGELGGAPSTATVPAAGGGRPLDGEDQVAMRLAEEIRRTCQYQAKQDPSAPVAQVVLTGWGADSPELAQSIAAGLDLPVTVEAPASTVHSSSVRPCGAAVAGGLCVEEAS